MRADTLPAHISSLPTSKTHGLTDDYQETDSNDNEEIDQPPLQEKIVEIAEGDGFTQKAAIEAAWHLAKSAFRQDEAITIPISDYNKGGLLTKWIGLPGFVPASQLENFPDCHIPSKRLDALSTWVGKELTVKIIELDRRTNRLIFSERAALSTVDARTRLLNRLDPGDKLKGRVTNMASFGVFVDLGGVEGLIHISELSWGRVVDPADFVQQGQVLEVVVLEVDQREERIALSRKRLLNNPWEAIEERYQPGQIVQGVITNFAKFGAFAEVEEGLEGLVHISEITDQPFDSMNEVLAMGENVQARVLEVNGKKRRLSLSLKL